MRFAVQIFQGENPTRVDLFENNLVALRGFNRWEGLLKVKNHIEIFLG